MTQLDTALWRDMMAYLRDRHAPICRQWFEDLEPVGIDSGTIHIRTTTPGRPIIAFRLGQKGG